MISLRLLLSVMLVFLIVIISCSHSGSAIAGKWTSRNATLDISRDGDNYIIKANNPAGLLNGTFAGPYKDGRVTLGNSLFGDVTYSKDQDMIYFAGEQFKRAPTN
jgi:hypothetical protein